MSEISIDSSVFISREAQPRERTSLRDKIGNIKKHFVTKIFRRSEAASQLPKAAKEKLPQQVVDEKSIYEALKRVNPERAKRAYREGCGLRSAISAVAHATEEHDIRPTDDEWKSWFHNYDAYNETLREHDAALKRGEAPKDLKDLYQDLKDAYLEFAKTDTPLGKALGKVDISIVREATKEDIKARIEKGEQVLVHIDAYETMKSHLLHAGLDEKGNIISLSDRKKKIIGMKPRYRKESLSDASTHAIFIITPKEAISTPAQVTSKDFELAA